ncbi:gas vesicle protein [Natroniella sulfidigena]|uniref:gas vesicle protein GvpO n=1 Tax=Natroniella sulfidigena TaxID=723921 RepID=UPI00200A933D|nr:gas vesicle protein GvpO [Natroniella sulfidigena]MCK8817055.1 gas vesicle protein [Natroniella sulfidigena]
MSINRVLKSVKQFFAELLGEEIEVISVIPGEGGWKVEFEVIVEDEYMRKRARKDIVARYQVQLNNKLEIVAYNRIELKERGALEYNERGE